MTISVGTLWIIYVAVLIGTWILLWVLLNRSYNKQVNYGGAFFLATIVGAIAAFVGAAWLDPNQLTDTDKTWLTVLFLVAFLLPVFVLVYLFWVSSDSCPAITDSCPPIKECLVKRTVQCDAETGICCLQKETFLQPDGNITEIIYSG